MDKIFNGVMQAQNISELQKEKVLGLVKRSATFPHGSEEVKAVLTSSLSYWLNADSTLDNAQLSSAVFKCWSDNRVDMMLEVLTTELTEYCDNSSTLLAVDQLLSLLSHCLGALRNRGAISTAYTKCTISNELGTPDDVQPLVSSFLSLVSKKVIVYLLTPTLDLAHLSNISSLLLEYPAVIPYDNVVALSCGLVKQLSIATLQVDVRQEDRNIAFIRHALRTCKLVKYLWFKSDSHKQTILLSLQTLFHIVSANQQTDNVSVALSTILQSVPQTMIDEVCMNLVKDSNVTDDQITNALRHMITWLQWPKHVTLHLWIIKICFCLAESGRQIILFEITDEMALSIASKLWYKHIQSTVLEVFTTLLLFHHKCPQAFHRSLPLLVKAFDEMKEKELKEQLSELIQTLMYLHPGYPELYHPLTTLLSDYQVLSESCMQTTLNRFTYSMYTTKKYAMTGSQSSTEDRGDKMGLENLGNTCFLNAVVQALYNIDAFQSAILSADVGSSPVILKELQSVLAFLHLSPRGSYRPDSFVEASLPSWFVAGEQQDSSEYLRYVLDGMHEEVERVNRRFQAESPSLLTDYSTYFTGSDTVTTECGTCSSQSSTLQKFYDISLHFSDEHSNSGQLVHLTDMLSNAFKEEQLQGDNQFYCDNCAGLQDATRTLSGFSLPSCLVLTLCRFSYSIKLGKHTKIRTPVQYPATLEILNRNYRLNAVIVHSGTSLNGGHYYTYASSLATTEQWYLFNDSRVTPCTSPAQMSNNHSKNGRLSSDTPYILFYTDVASVPEGCQLNVSVNPSLRQLVVKDDLISLRHQRAEDERKAARKKSCQNSNLSWYSYTDDDDQTPPGADNSVDLSGSRFIF